MCVSVCVIAAFHYSLTIWPLTPPPLILLHFNLSHSIRIFSVFVKLLLQTRQKFDGIEWECEHANSTAVLNMWVFISLWLHEIFKIIPLLFIKKIQYNYWVWLYLAVDTLAELCSVLCTLNWTVRLIACCTEQSTLIVNGNNIRNTKFENSIHNTLYIFLSIIQECDLLFKCFISIVLTFVQIESEASLFCCSWFRIYLYNKKLKRQSKVNWNKIIGAQSAKVIFKPPSTNSW